MPLEQTVTIVNNSGKIIRTVCLFFATCSPQSMGRNFLSGYPTPFCIC